MAGNADVRGRPARSRCGGEKRAGRHVVENGTGEVELTQKNGRAATDGAFESIMHDSQEGESGSIRKSSTLTFRRDNRRSPLSRPDANLPRNDSHRDSHRRVSSHPVKTPRGKPAGPARRIRRRAGQASG
ncbi:hypothetical protein [Burkholderia gladioli]|uniref:hypothetical protein n=1 Tax=Burkholderia gladioli TaxID=28095 RepID=UPI001641DD67|nr:hypothetical protein [Burkholderia gladioli]MBJ9677057.1 hypothetical protein [Burkholderia gladioli]MDN7462489.1 hypothetical protein [Burkholderia gladioli]